MARPPPLPHWGGPTMKASLRMLSTLLCMEPSLSLQRKKGSVPLGHWFQFCPDPSQWRTQYLKVAVTSHFSKGLPVQLHSP